LSRITNSELDGVIIAAAGLIRLGWEDRISDYLPIEYFLPAVGQGALAIETRIDDEETVRLVSGINHLPTRQSVTAERALLRTMGGDCHAPIAALGTLSGKTLRLRGMFAEPDRNQIVTDTEEGATTEAEEIGICLARKLLNRRTAGLTLEARKNDQR
jgi:hydroxymethylbilane synthase